MFKIDVSPTYLYPVEIKMLDEKGKEKSMGFKAVFNRLSQPDIKATLKRIDEKDIDDEEMTQLILAGWEGIQDEEGNALAFNANNRDALCSIYPVQARLIEAWFESLEGAARKN